MIEIVVNGEPRACLEESTLAALCRELRLPDRGVAIAVNYELVPRARSERVILYDQDVVEIVSATAGG